ncbi:hypothetical protein QAD02_011875 [Eretmocerus hayati]|uniref:Uncharacterized protein n=1 Tax=Eretmocerus hayati TaxID=131215 RepID=A0ACC2NXT0_9HYME|nr:hypothetical protein QAD02_011875 [Eretmocerus hayati]
MWSIFVLFLITSFVTGNRMRNPGPQCNIYKGNKHLCAGIIITKHEVLAPAHCVENWHAEKLNVRILTSYYIIEDNHEVIEVKIHEGFDARGDKRVNDIAVIRVSGTLGGPHAYAKFLDENTIIEPGTFGTIFGFEHDIADDKEWAMNEADVLTVSKEACERYIKDKLPQGQFCVVTGTPGKGPKLCPGDTGMSFYAVHEFIGLASYWIGIEAGECSTRAVYTDIAYHREFIDNSLEYFKQKAENKELKANAVGTGNYIVSIEKDAATFLCTGAIISQYEIITSAACARRNSQKYSGKPTMIRAGTDMSTQKGQVRKEINTCYCDEHHPGLDNIRRRNHDIAVVRVDYPFNFIGEVSAINLYQTGEELKAYEIGILSFFRNGSSLEKETVQTVNRDYCKQNYSTSPYGTIADDHVCASPSRMCENNNGGVLVVDNKLAGIATFGVESCSDQRSPDVFTSIAKLRKDIDGCRRKFAELVAEGTIDQYGDYRGWFEKIITSILD